MENEIKFLQNWNNIPFDEIVLFLRIINYLHWKKKWHNFHEVFSIFCKIDFFSLSIKFSYEIFSTWHLMDNVFMWNVWLSFFTKGILNKETMPWWFQKGPSTVITSHFLEYIEINVGHKCFISFPQTKVLWGNV